MITFHAFGFGKSDLKSLVKSTASRFYHFIAIKEIKRKKKKTLPFSTLIGTKDLQGHYII